MKPLHYYIRQNAIHVFPRRKIDINFLFFLHFISVHDNRTFDIHSIFIFTINVSQPIIMMIIRHIGPKPTQFIEI